MLEYDSSERSSIVSDSFFLSPEGRVDPYAELLATIESFQTKLKKSDKQDSHSQCQFRGRFVWLRTQLELEDYGIRLVECDLYNSLFPEDEIDSISLVFATGFLGNPASYYGHLLLKTNKHAQSRSTTLEDNAFNYGAIIPENENMIVYILKGVFGMYESGFSHRQYYFHAHNYADLQLRDLWEYELNLTREDRDLILAHAWELLNKHNKYYFFDRNCAYRMAKLIELVVDDTVVNDIKPWNTPQSIVQRVSEIQYQDQNFIKEVKYRPSKQSQFRMRFFDLNLVERSFVKEVVVDISKLDSQTFSDFSIVSKQKILDALTAYYGMQLVYEKNNPEPVKAELRQVMIKRFEIEPGVPEVNFYSEKSPALGRKPSYISVGGLHYEDFDTGYSLRIRPAYYDSLDSNYGHIKNSTLTMADLTVIGKSSTWAIQNFDFVNIESQNVNITGLQGDNHHSWKIQVGLKNMENNFDGSPRIRANGDIGLSNYFINEAALVGVYVGGELYDSPFDEQRMALHARASLNLNLSGAARLRIDSVFIDFIQGSLESVNSKVEFRKSLGRDFDLRCFAEKHGFSRYGASLGYYW